MSADDEARLEYAKALRFYNWLLFAQTLLIMPGSVVSIMLFAFAPFWGAMVGGCCIVLLMCLTCGAMTETVRERERHLKRWMELEEREEREERIAANAER